MRILLVGRQGQVARELRSALACLGEVTAVDRRSRPPVDLADPATIRHAVDEIRPALVVNAAAYTAVDKAEAEASLAWQINAVAPGILAESAARVGAGLIHYSTDYVYPGDAAVPYREEDPTGPRNVYGRSKLAGDEAIAQVGGPHWILRTAWVYGLSGHNFLLTMLRLMRERPVVKVVDDQLGTPTWSRLIAQTTALMLARSMEKGRFALGDRGGVYHLTCGGATTWCGFARQIRDAAIGLGRLPPACGVIEPIPTSAYPTPAQRPAYSVLSNAKLEQRFGFTLPAWDAALELCLNDLPYPPVL